MFTMLDADDADQYHGGQDYSVNEMARSFQQIVSNNQHTQTIQLPAAEFDNQYDYDVDDIMFVMIKFC